MIERPNNEHLVRHLIERPNNEHLVRHLIERPKNEHRLLRHLIERPKNEHLVRHLIERPKNEHLVRHLIERPKNEHLLRHLIERPKNAKYTSKIIKNEIVSVAADLYRNYIRECLNKCPYFSIIVGETTSQGGLVLSICIRLLDCQGDPSNPCKREFLLDICDLPSSTGEAIANVIRKTLKKHKINIADCKGQANDTTASMSSDKKGVQAEIMKFAPDADYQGCCLHRLNLVICHACKIISITNMMDTLRELQYL